VIAQILAAIETAAIAAKIDELHEIGRPPPVLDRTQRLSETSTASVVRSCQWAARCVGVRCPDLYPMDDFPGLGALVAFVPSTAVGPHARSGLTAKELAFIAGRHLTLYRAEYRLLLYYPTREEMTLLLQASARLAKAGSTRTEPGAVAGLRKRLALYLREGDRRHLHDSVRSLEDRGGQVRVGAWMRSAELTAARAGLLLCGDLSTATSRIRLEPAAVADISPEERRVDLVAFCASPAHAELRRRFAVQAPAVQAPAARVAPEGATYDEPTTGLRRRSSA
jgi:hypothetical protein